MTFGLTDTPAAFHGYIHEASRDLLDIVCIAYLDDILIFSKTKAHKRLRRAGPFAKSLKYRFNVYKK